MKKHTRVISTFALFFLAGLSHAETGAGKAAAPAAVPTEHSALETMRKRKPVEADKSAVPADVSQGAKAAGDAVDKSKAVEVPTTPAAVKEPVQEAVQQKLKQAIPTPAKEGVKAVEEGLNAPKSAADKAEQVSKEAGKAAKSAKHKAEKSTVDKAKELLR